MRKVLGAGVAMVFALVVGLAAGAAQAAPLTAKQALGKQLFFDKSLSHGGNQSCGSCHSPSSAFTDPNKLHATSAGDNPALFGPRNAPTAMYMAFSPDFQYDATEGLYIGGQFVDGRAATLELQALAPFLNPIEMGAFDRAEVINNLMASPTAAAFSSVFGPTAFDDVDAAFLNIANAIADYERSSELSPFTSKFDYYLDGRVSLTAQEQRGLQLFSDPMKANCSACHITDVGPNGEHPLLTDFTYDNIGIPKNFQSDFLNLPSQFNPDGQAFLDLGLGGIVGDDTLYGAFKVTTLRNISLTGPYGHNGYFQTLDQIIDFYATRDVKPACAVPTLTATEAEAMGCWPGAEFAAQMNVDELGNLPLTAQDKEDIKAFLGTLTDGYAVPEPATWAMMITGFGLLGARLRRRRVAAARGA